MNIKLVNRGDTAEVLLEGELNSVTAPQIQSGLEQLTEQYKNIIINMEKLTYISSAGLRVLNVLFKRLVKKGGALYVSEVRPNVMEILEMTGFMTILQIIQ